MALVEIRNVEPKDAIATFEQRIANPYESYSWLDVWQALHNRAFTVAKSAGFDVVGDIAGALDDAIKNGETFDTFAKNLVPTLQSKGWWGQGPAFDPLTGETTISQLGSLRRLRVIYDTNMRNAFAAGRWTAIQRVKADRPFLRYMHTTSEHPRLKHLPWVDTVLPVDDPWWQTHYPPNGWGCKCSVVTLSQRQFDALAGRQNIRTAAPPIDWGVFTNKRTGETSLVPANIDPGFAYNAGEAFLQALTGG